MKKMKTNKMFLWMTTGALAMGFGIAALPTSPEDDITVSAATTAEVVGTTFSDDFSKYSSYGQAGTTGVGVRTTSGEGWTNQWFDGVGDGTYDAACTSEYASITTDPADSSNQVLYLNTNKNEQSFFYLTPTMDGTPLVLKNYELSFKFKISESTKAEDRRTAAPWFGTLNRKTITGASSYEPGDGRFNGTNSLMTALRAGVKSTDASTQANYFYSFSQKFMYDSTTDIPLAGEKTSSGSRGELDNCVYPDTVYNEWHAYKCVINEDSFDIYLDGKHMGGAELGSSTGFNCVKVEGYISIALCVADIYVDDVNISEILPLPGLSGASEATMRADKTKDTNFTLVNTKTIGAIKKGTEALAASAYALSSDGKTLTIKKAYIDTLGIGSHTLSVTASDGTDEETFDITIVITEIPGVAGGNNTVTVQMGSAASIALVNVDTISSIVKDGAAVTTNVYSYASASLSFTNAYISKLGLGTHTFTVNTNNGEFTLTLVIKEKPAVDGNAMVHVTQGDAASFTLKNVASIASVTYNGSEIPTSAYSYSNNVITFTGEYTATLSTSRQAHVLNTDAGALTVTLYVKAATVTDEAVANVITLIGSIPTEVTSRNSYTSALSAYNTANEAYTALTSDQQAKVTNASELTTAKNMLDAFAAKISSADAVDQKIESIPTTVSTRENYATALSAYNTANEAYVALDSTAQGLVTKVSTLTTAKNTLDAFAAKIASADEVDTLIAAIPTSVADYEAYVSAKDAYNTAKSAYDNLDTDVQELVTKKDSLTSAKSMLEAFEANLGEANAVIAKIDSIPASISTRGAYNSALNLYNTALDAYNELSAEQQANVTNADKLTTAKAMLEEFAAKIASADEVDALIAAIPTTVTTRENYATALSAYNTAKSAFDGLSEDVQKLVTKSSTLTTAKNTLDTFAAKIASADEVDTLITDIPTAVNSREEYDTAKSAYDTAKAAYDDLSSDVQGLVTKKDALTAAKEMLTAFEANLGEADAVITKINAIPTSVTTRNNYLSAQNAYTVAKAAYDGLSEDQKASVTNADKLTTAKEMLDAFAAKIASADEVDALIADIPTSVISREEYASAKSAYDTAKAAYDDLDADVQTLVTKSATLTSANNTLTAFKADIDAADEVDEKIAAISSDEITAENYDERYAAVVEAEKLYNDLSITAQELVNNYADLQARREELTAYESTLGNSADGVITLISNIPASIETRGDYTSAKSAYETALAAYEALEASVQADVTNADTLTTAKAMLTAFEAKMASADEVDAKIEDVPTTVTTREDYVAVKSAYDTAKSAFDGLSEDVQKLVTKASTLTAVNTTLTTFKTNMDAADAVDALIAAIPTAVNSREEYASAKSAYDTAKAAYDEASETVLNLVTKDSALTATKDMLDAFKSNMDAAESVDAKIEAIPTSVTTRGGYTAANEAYDTAKSAYDNLSGAQKALVTKVSVLTSAKDMLDVFAAKMASADAIDVLITAIPESVSTREEFTSAKNKYDVANDALNNANEEVQNLVNNKGQLSTAKVMLESFAANIVAADAVDSKIEAIPTSVNSRVDYEAAKAAYEAAKQAYDESDVQDLVLNATALTTAESMLEAFEAKLTTADAVDSQINALSTTVTTRGGYNTAKEAYEEAQAAYDGLDADVKVLVTNASRLSVVKADLEEFAAKIALADAIDVLIGAIPTAVTSREEYATAAGKYDAAKLAYDNLESDEAALVTKVSVLTSAKDMLDTFKAKMDAANAVVAKIAALTTEVNSVTEKAAALTAYNEAKLAFDNLDATAQSLVTNVDGLAVAKAAIDGYKAPTASIAGDTEVTVRVGEDAVFTLEAVTSIVSVNIDANGEFTALEANAYTYADSKLTIHAAYIQTLESGWHTFFVTVDGNVELDPITVNYTPASVSGISAVMFEKATDGDVTFVIENAESVTKLVREKTVSADCYSYADGTLTIKAIYLKSLTGGEHTFTVTTDNGDVTVSVTITARVTVKLTFAEGISVAFAADEDGIAEIEEGTEEDVVFRLKGVPSRAVITLKVGEDKKLSSEAYSYASNKLTINAAYVKTLTAGTKELTMEVEVPAKNETPSDDDSGKKDEESGCGSSFGFAGTMMAVAVLGGLAISRKRRK